MSENRTRPVDILSLPSFQNDPRGTIVSLAIAAKVARRYDDMCKFMSTLVQWATTNNSNLSTEERSLLADAYEGSLTQRRLACMALDQKVAEEKHKDAIVAFRAKVTEEMSHLCEEVAHLLEGCLLHSSSSSSSSSASPTPSSSPPPTLCPEVLVFYQTMLGEYYRRWAECQGSSDLSSIKNEKALHYLHKARELADQNLEPHNPVRLTLLLSYSTAVMDVMQDAEKACEIAQSAFGEGLKVSDLDEHTYQVCTSLLATLRKNINKWSDASTAPTIP